MAILDARTLLSGFQTGDTVPQPDDLAGAAGGTPDAEIFIRGIRSYGYYTTSTRAGLLYDHGSAQDWSNNVFYLWVNCGVAGLLDTFANGGLAVRFAGETVTNWFEVFVGGSDIYPAAVSGGWVMLVVDIEAAKAISDSTGGTPPATTAIRYVGVSTITGGTMPRMVDNTWLQAVWRQPDSQPGITVEATNTGVVPWTWQDIVDAGDVADPTKAWGTIKRLANGTIALNTGIRFGADNTTTHLFEDVNEAVGFEDQLVADDIGDGRAFYRLQVYGNAGGTTEFALGVKAGTGDDATGSQGGAILSGGPLFDIDLVGIGNNDISGLFGVNINGMKRLTANSAVAEVISCQLNDSLIALVSNGIFIRNRILQATSGDGVGFVQTDDISDVKFCDFLFSDGHGVTILTGGPSTQTSMGNLFSSYSGTPGSNGTPSSGSNDAAVYNNAEAARTINVTDGGDVPSVRNGASATTIVQAAITITFTGITAGTEVRVYLTGTSTEADGTESAGGTSFAAALQASTGYDVVAIRPGYVPVRRNNVSFAGSQDFPLNQVVDLNFNNP